MLHKTVVIRQGRAIKTHGAASARRSMQSGEVSMSMRKAWLAIIALMVAYAGSARAEGPVELQWWHAMTAVNGAMVNKIADDFNKSQTAYKVVPVYKGNYPEAMSAGIAAFRAGNAPAILQVFEVGTATIDRKSTRLNSSHPSI